MSTRSGRVYKRTVAAEDTTMSMDGGVTELIKFLVEDRKRQDERLAEERQRQEEQLAEERRRQEDQLQRFLQLVEGGRSASGSEERGRREEGPGEVKLNRLCESDDIEAYLITFERLMRGHEVPESRWAFRLAPQLTGRAQQAYAALPAHEASSYSGLKAAILRRYDINEETYRQRFRSASKKSSESYRELVVRLQDLHEKWTRDCKTVAELREVAVMEQFLNSLPASLRLWVRERTPKTVAEAAQLADQFVQAHKQAQDGQKSNRGSTDERDRQREDKTPLANKRCFSCGQVGHLRSSCVVGNGPARSAAAAATQPSKPDVRCYNCGRKGHVAIRCPSRALCGLEKPQPMMYRRGQVEGTWVGDILLDTGCTRTMVHNKLVPPSCIQEGRVTTIRCAHGDTLLYPLAEVTIQVADKTLVVEAAVSATLPVSVLLGTDAACLEELLKSGCSDDAYAVTTRRQKKQQELDFRAQEQKRLESEVCARDLLSGKLDSDSGVADGDSVVVDGVADGDSVVVEGVTNGDSCGVDSGDVAHGNVDSVTAGDGGEGDCVGVSNGDCGDGSEGGVGSSNGGIGSSDGGDGVDEGSGNVWEFDFDDDHFEPKEDRARVSKKQKAEDKRKHWKGMRGSHELEMSAEEVQRLQKEDPTLSKLWMVAKEESSELDSKFVIMDGLLFHRWVQPNQLGVEPTYQLVLPQACREAVLHLAHHIPLAGHMGKEKTTRRIQQRFYWPTLHRDVKRFCRSCGECQKSSNRKPPRAPLVPLPIMEEPFQRLAMDIVGPLPRSRAGNRYILVLVDYATRYPEAIPLKTIDAEVIAEQLASVFARVGIPQELLTDQGTNFTSKLLKELYKLLHVQAIRTSPYHPQTDGVVERFNQTLKAMIRKFVTDEGRDWDKLIPFLLFAYREVPQSSTGFTPFELLYGRSVRGPLDVLREAWETPKHASESVVSYVLHIRDRLEKMVEVVQSNMTSAQERQKRWYDQKARTRQFVPREQVLVLLPTSTQKLLAQWHGPYRVVQRMGRVNYKVDMQDKKKRHRIFHVNMLRKWQVPTTSVCLAVEEDENMEDDVQVWKEEPRKEEFVINDALESDQQKELRKLLDRYSDVLTGAPGCTKMIEHRIAVDHIAHPVRRPPYRVPQAYRELVRSELREMLAAGIIKPSESSWAAPIVLVKKRDGSLRLCVDYRRLNAVCKPDPYPMPRVDELLDQLGKAQFITTLDLARDYWQVPMAEESRNMTAFITPFGQFEFTVMPFGLSGAPGTFQRIMDGVVVGKEEFAAAYLDDLVIYSSTWTEHLAHIEAILQKLREAGLTAKPAKCRFGMKESVYLGHVVGKGTVKPEASKLQAVEDYPIPETKQQLRRFLGLAGYYRRFIRNFATVASPLTDLTRKSEPNHIQWSPTCNKAFNELKARLCQPPVLSSPDFGKPFILQTDASNKGIGAVLSQKDEAGEEHPVAFYSRKLLPREERYSTVEQECLAIKLAVQAFRYYLLGRPFMIQTDHRSLEWLDRLKENNSRLSRWSLSLQPFDFTVQHRPGPKNTNADSLSRVYAT